MDEKTFNFQLSTFGLRLAYRLTYGRQEIETKE